MLELLSYGIECLIDKRKGILEEYGFGLLDYLFITPIIILAVVLTIASLMSGRDYSGTFIFNLFIIAIISIPIMYYYNMPNGQYLAKFTEVDGMKIGEGTWNSKTFEIIKTDDSFILNRNKYWKQRFDLKKYKKWYDDIYLKTYEEVNGNKYLTLTRFGYLMLHDKNGTITSKLQVNY